jgi:hypothetical protein
MKIPLMRSFQASAIAVAVIAPVAAAPPVVNPAVSAPVTGGARGQAFGAWQRASTPAGYVVEERFFSGKATAHGKAGSWGVDGMWEATPTTTADYRVRMLVRRPKDAARYATLMHPGDAYSYDIFSQGAQALRHPQGVDPIGGLRVRQMIATGRSQSAFRLVTYINAVHPLTHLFDGFLVHSRGANASGITAEGMSRDAAAPIPAGAHIRADIDVPVFDLQTEGDMVALRAHLTRQDPGPHYRRWEIAGAAHAETPRWVVEVPPPLDFGQGCTDAVNAAPNHAVVKAALHALTRWVRDGVAPRQSPAIELSDPAAADPVVRDSFGNAKGGIRLPELEAPTARMDGGQNAVAQAAPGAQNFCFLFGHTVPFDGPRLASLYATHDAYVKKFGAAVDALVRDGYWMKPEGDASRKAAEQSHIGVAGR